MDQIYLPEGSVECLAVPKMFVSIGDLYGCATVMRNFLYQEATELTYFREYASN
jgi:hypothetical protein